MLNIISRSIVSNNISGPQKVVENLIKGLNIIGYPYCINKDLDATSQLWIHDDPLALKEASRLGLKAIVGPNIYVLPRNIPNNIVLSKFVYIHPSEWAMNFWKYLGFKKCILDFWPTGIDTDEFPERVKPENGSALIYFKQRRNDELDFIKKILERNKINYDIISYGRYEQKDYLKKLKNTKYIIWLGRQESQGIALEEAMSMNVPILVWDVMNIGHWVPNKKESTFFSKEESEYEETTSAYYFDNSCGIKIKEQKDVENSLYTMEKEWRSFEPRNYILKNLSLEKQARDFIELFNKYYNISYIDGQKENLKNNKKWINDKITFKVFIKIKEIVKKCVNSLKN